MLLKRQNGASAVEFAILLPFLVLLVFGIIEFGLLMYNQQVLTNASREGARAAIAGKCAARLTDTQISDIVRDYCIYTNTSGSTVRRLITGSTTNTAPATSIEPSPSACSPGGPGLSRGDAVTVTVDWEYTFLFPSLLGFGTTKELQANTVMKMMSDP